MQIIGEPLGEGSYGRVYRAVHATRGEVAVKRLLVHEGSNFLFSLREIELGCKFEHPNILKLREIRTLPPVWTDACPDGTRDDDLCLVYDLADCDLYTLCDREDISEQRARNFISQILLAVEYLHNNNYVHRDIRPANILRFSRDRVKLCDLGFCKKYHKYDEHDTNINAPYFRAPELLTSSLRTGPAADIWSVGCVMHYMLSRELVSDNLDDEIERDYTKQEQLQALIDKYPFPVDKTILDSGRGAPKLKYNKKTDINEFMKVYISKLKSVSTYIDFLSGMLTFNPDKRSTATLMILHPYLSAFSNIANVTRAGSIDLMDESKKYEVTLGHHRELIKGSTIKLFADYRNKAEWYTDSAIFMAIDIYDRLLTRVERIREMTEKNLNTYFRSCVYLAGKYYTTHYVCNLDYKTFPLQDFAPYTLKCGEDFETAILELLEYDLYSVTILDEYKKEQRPTTRTVLSLLLFVMEGRHADLTPSEALNLWKENDLMYLDMSATILKDISAQRIKTTV